MPGSSPKRRKSLKRESIKREESPERLPPVSAEDEEELFKDDEDDPVDSGLDGQRQLPDFGAYAVQPIYDDVEAQFPHDPLDLTNRALVTEELSYDYGILLGDDVTDAELLEESEDVLSDDNINAFLAVTKRGPFSTKKKSDTGDAKGNPCTLDDLADYYSLLERDQPSFAAIGISDEDFFDSDVSPASSARDSFFLNSFSDSEYDLMDDQPLAHISLARQQQLPQDPDGATMMMNMLSTASDMAGVSGMPISDQAWCAEQLLRSLNIKATPAGSVESSRFFKYNPEHRDEEAESEPFHDSGNEEEVDSKPFYIAQNEHDMQ